TEYRIREVQEVFQGVLGRPADPLGLIGGVGFLAAGGSADQLRAFLMGTPEYLLGHGGGTPDGFLNAVAQDTLGHSLDGATAAACRALLAQGFTPAQVAALFLGSPEHRLVETEGLYERFLHRPADLPGLNAIASALVLGVPEDLLVAFLV